MSQPLRVLILINDVQKLKLSQSTAEIIHAVRQRGHDGCVAGVSDLSWGRADEPLVSCRSIPVGERNEVWLERLQHGPNEKRNLLSWDLILVRTNPARDKNRRWAHDVLLDLLTWVEDRGVVVLNSPKMLRLASSKMYLQRFPESIRPRSLISHSAEDIVQFVEQQTKNCILKPLCGTGGSSVFIVKPDDLSNLHQIIEVISTQDFVIAQEYIEEAHIGDARLLVVNGEILSVEGKPALVARLRQGHDVRSNVAVGGKPAEVAYSQTMQQIVDVIKPKLVADGVFLAGLDVIGNKIVEINVFSPGGFGDAGRFADRDFIAAYLEAAEKKVSESR